MTKPPEEGRIWEWRAFGRVTASLAAKVSAYPIRLGISDLRGEDVYLVSPNSDQNVKLRRYAGGWVLKFKLLLESNPGPFELYSESVARTHLLPVPIDWLEEAARLLEVKLPETALSATSFGRESFVKALEEASPPIAESRVSKKRTQYQFVEEGWLEVADVKFARDTLQSISIHSPDLDIAKEMLQILRPGVEMEAMNYIQACRRWG